MFKFLLIFLITNQLYFEPQERNLYFTPYLSAFENYAAKPIDSPDDNEQQYIGATKVGEKVTNTSSIVPGGFSGNLFQPGQYSTPMSHLGNTTPFPQSSVVQNPFGINQMNQNQTQTQTQTPLIESNPLQVPRLQVRQTCDSIKKQAVEISNAILNEQYKRIFKFLTKYLQNSDYIVNMSQVKMTRTLRKELFDIMNAYSSLTTRQVQFSDAAVRELTNKELEDALSGLDFEEETDNELSRGPTVDANIPKL